MIDGYFVVIAALLVPAGGLADWRLVFLVNLPLGAAIVWAPSCWRR